MLESFSAFPSVALAAKHLAVVGNSAAPIVPWRDVVGLHLAQLEVLAAVGAETHLSLVGRQLLRIGEGTDREIFLLPRENVWINARFFCYVIVENEALHFIINRLIIKHLFFILLIKHPPLNTFHDLFALLGGTESGLDPSDDRLEKLAQRCGARVVLVVRHVYLDVAVRNPRDGGFEIILADSGAIEVVAANLRGRCAVFAEIAFGIAHPRAGIHRVAQLLFGECLTRNIDGAEPLELLAVGAATDVDLQRVVEDLLLLVGLQVVEIAEVEGEVTVDVLADADGALLPVNDFETGFATIPVATCGRDVREPSVAHGPIHHVEREALRERVDDGIALFVLVDELALIGWAHVKAATICAHSVFVVVHVSLRELADGDFV